MQRQAYNKLAIWLFGSIMGFIIILLFDQTAPILAQQRPTPTPTIARRPAWGTGRQTGLPRHLQRTVRTSGGGGPISTRICEGVLGIAGQPIYDIFPDSGAIIVGHPHIPVSLIIGACHAAGPETVYLIDPAGRRIQPTKHYQDVICDPTGNDCYRYEFSLGATALSGKYLLHIESAVGLIETSLTVSRPTVPYLIITDSATGRLIEEGQAQPGQSLTLDFEGFRAEANVEVTLYGTDINKNLQQSVIDAWQFQVDAQGHYREELLIPTNVRTDRYFVVACMIDQCQPTLDSYILPSVIYSDIAAPPLAWASFFVGNSEDNSATSAVVDPVIAWNGLILKDKPTGVLVAVLPANSAVTLLPSELIYDDAGVAWREVRDNASGKEGWVKERYLLIGDVEDMYFNLYWAPGCDPERIEVELLRAGEERCDGQAETLSLDEFADELRTIGLLKTGEWIQASTPSTRRNEAILIRTQTNPRVGWLKIGTTFPLNAKRSPVGAVWRTPYSSNRLTQNTSVCWFRQDNTWRCEDD